MTKRVFFQSFFLSVLGTALILSMIQVGQAEVMSSGNYMIQSDSVNIGGGLSSSTSYVQESTVGEIATGPSDSTSYSMRSGYQQMQEAVISLEVSNSVVLKPDLGGLTGGTSTGSTTITVVTDNPAGYQLTFVAESTPAMQSDIDSIDDYDAGVTADYSFVFAGTEARFGYTPEGEDIAQEFLNDAGNTCGVGSLDHVSACWQGPSTTPRIIAQANGATHPIGATTVLRFQVGIGSDAVLMAGVYTATTTITALPL